MRATAGAGSAATGRTRLRPGASGGTFDLVFTGSVALLAAISSVAIALDLSVSSAALDVAINTIGALAGAGAAGLAWTRFSEFGERPAALEASAFLVVLASRGLLVILAILGLAGPLGLSLEAPQQWPLYAWSLARALTPILLIVAAWQALRPSGARPLSSLVIAAVPTVAIVMVIALLPAIEASLPAIMDEAGFAALRGEPGGRPGMTPVGLVFQAVIAGLYLWGAGLHRRLYRRGNRRYAGYLSIALIVAAFSQLHWAILPGIYSPAVVTDDLLRAAFSIILLVGIEAQLRSDVRALRRANVRLEELRHVEVQRVALETRAQLAREVHDGLAQELWFAKLKSGRLAQLDGLPSDARELAGELSNAVDRALGESRVALTAIRAGLDGELPFGGSLDAYVADFGERAGIATRFEGAADIPSLRPRAAAEVLRIVVEALANVAKHAQASEVIVTARRRDSTIEISVADNGRGFDVDDVDATRFGIRGMRERAAVIGGRLDVTSTPGRGTTVILAAPIETTGEAGEWAPA
ncbi:MAG: sensor histidine kinase [Chloroflexi bacterium]|nr:sensor histidine kinase [Chloroflexota bacterium]